jgi:hypothetical protein
MKKNNFIKKKIKGITVDVRAKDCLYIKIKLTIKIEKIG